MSGDIIRIGNRIVTKAWAQARGLLDADGNVKGDAAPKLRGNVKRGPASNKARRAKRLAASPDGIDIPIAEVLKPKRIKPLKPRNVDHDGNEVTDPEVLAKIAAAAPAVAAAPDPVEAEREAQRKAMIKQSEREHDLLAGIDDGNG